MTINYIQAKAQMLALASVGWQTSNAVISQVAAIPLITQNNEPDVPYDPGVYYARFSIVTALSPQTAFAGNANGNDNRQITTKGTVFVQLFSPIVDPKGADNLDLLGLFVQGILRTRPGCPDVILTNVRIKELPADGNYFRCNVVADFSYDETA